MAQEEVTGVNEYYIKNKIKNTKTEIGPIYRSATYTRGDTSSNTSRDIIITLRNDNIGPYSLPKTGKIVNIESLAGSAIAEALTTNQLI